MAKVTQREIEESYDRAGWLADDEDLALIRHVSGDDERPPQGLHQGGYKHMPECEWCGARGNEPHDPHCPDLTDEL